MRLREPRVIKLHAAGDGRSRAIFNHAADGICTVIDAETACGAVISGVAKTTEWQFAASAGGASIHVQAAGFGLLQEARDAGLIFGEDAGGEAESGCVGLLDRVVEILDDCDAQERAKDFDVVTGCCD